MPRQHEEIDFEESMFAGNIAEEMELQDAQEEMVGRLAKRRLSARRAIEDYRERKQLHDELDDWDYQYDDEL